MTQIWQATSLGWFLRTGRTSMSSLEPRYLRASGSYWKPLNASKEPSPPIRLEMGIRRLSSLATPLRGRWSPLMKGFPRNIAGRNIVCFVKSMGAHTPPTILRTAGSTSPTVTQRRHSMGRRPMDPLVDLRDLLEERRRHSTTLLGDHTGRRVEGGVHVFDSTDSRPRRQAENPMYQRVL